ncbi:MAG: DUF3667 domain-containing protein [Pseudomonadota bacterium]
MSDSTNESSSFLGKPCTNCDAILVGDYCHACGQRSKEPRRLVIGLVQDVIVETLSVDSKLARTVWLLFRAPGRLAKAYVTGKRVRYTPPFRLYLFTSVLFFAALFWMLSSELGLDSPPELRNSANGSIEQTLEDEIDDPASGQESSESEPDDDTDININLGFGENSDLIASIEERWELAWDRLQDDPRLFMAQARENIPRVLLLAPLTYALMLVILYVYRRKFLLYDHLITSLYMHAALYGFLLAIMASVRIPIFGDLLAFLLGAWGMLQPYLALRQVYGSNWFSVAMKGTAIHISYLSTLTVLVTAGLGVALYNS